MPRRFLIKALVPLLILAAGVAAFYWLRSWQSPPERTAVTPKPPPVRTIVLGPPRQQFKIQVGGNVVPHREVTLSAEVTGQITVKPPGVRGGRKVTRGSLLLEIDPHSYELEIQQLDSRLAQLDIDLRRIDTEVTGNLALIAILEQEWKLATDEFTRIETLFAKNAASVTDRDRSHRQELQSRNSLRLLQNERDLLPLRRQRFQAERTAVVLQQLQARLDLTRTRVLAPFDGVLTFDGAETGDFVQQGDVLLRIEETAAIEVACHLRTDHLYWLWDSVETPGGAEIPNVAATVTYTVAGRPYHWQGRLSRYEGRGIDPKTRTVPCRVLVNAPRRANTADGPPALMRGMYVSVTLVANPKTRLLAIPAAALQPGGQVWTVSDETLSVHTVEVVRSLPEEVLVRADATTLQPGDHLVVSPLKTAYEGMPVREQPAAGGGSP